MGERLREGGGKGGRPFTSSSTRDIEREEGHGKEIKEGGRETRRKRGRGKGREALYLLLHADHEGRNGGAGKAYDNAHQHTACAACTGIRSLCWLALYHLLHADRVRPQARKHKQTWTLAPARAFTLALTRTRSAQVAKTAALGKGRGGGGEGV
jgi:hypothetical protein